MIIRRCGISFQQLLFHPKIYLCRFHRRSFCPCNENKVVSFLCLFTEQGFNKAERFSYDSPGTTAFYGIADLLACNDSYAVYPPLAFPCVAYERIGNILSPFLNRNLNSLSFFMQTYFFAYSFIDRISSLSAFCPLHVFLREPYVRFL